MYMYKIQCNQQPVIDSITLCQILENFDHFENNRIILHQDLSTRESDGHWGDAEVDITFEGWQQILMFTSN